MSRTGQFSKEILNKIFEKMKEYDRIMLFRHKRIDGDCVGSTKGLKAILKASVPEKEVYIIDDEHSDFLAFLGKISRFYVFLPTLSLLGHYIPTVKLFLKNILFIDGYSRPLADKLKGLCLCNCF